MLGLLSEAIRFALENDMIDEAKLLAKKPEGDSQEIIDFKKKLWLQVLLEFFQMSRSLDRISLN